MEVFEEAELSEWRCLRKRNSRVFEVTFRQVCDGGEWGNRAQEGGQVTLARLVSHPLEERMLQQQTRRRPETRSPRSEQTCLRVAYSRVESRVAERSSPS